MTVSVLQCSSVLRCLSVCSCIKQTYLYILVFVPLKLRIWYVNIKHFRIVSLNSWKFRLSYRKMHHTKYWNIKLNKCMPFDTFCFWTIYANMLSVFSLRFSKRIELVNSAKRKCASVRKYHFIKQIVSSWFWSWMFSNLLISSWILFFL